MATLPIHLIGLDPCETEYQNWVKEQVAPLGIGADLQVHIFYKANTCTNPVHAAMPDGFDCAHTATVTDVCCKIPGSFCFDCEGFHGDIGDLTQPRSAENPTGVWKPGPAPEDKLIIGSESEDDEDMTLSDSEDETSGPEVDDDEFEVFKLLNGGAAARSPGPVWVEPESLDDIILCDRNPGVST
eukprot:COSAG03_NODE_367_length_8529_cov_29.037841_6_plen_185_part_00